MNVTKVMLALTCLTQVLMSSTSFAADGDDREGILQEIVVTAQKRAERLQDVPVPVTVVSADALIESNQLRVEDYYTRVPGLSMTTSFYGQPSIVIRGLTTGVVFNNPTVGIVVDDVPYGSSTPLSGGSIFPDIDPSDLDSIEVLRGPQGTLYGASSLGGLVKFVTRDPSTQSRAGRLEADVLGAHDGGVGYGLRGSLNEPISDSLAVRASVSARRDPGYIDNVVNGAKDVNRMDTYGGRLSVLWKASDAVSVKLGALFQHQKQDGYDLINTEANFADLQQSVVPGIGASDRKYEIYTATVNAKLGGGADLTAITGYSINRKASSIDQTSGLSGYTYDHFAVNGTPLTDVSDTSKFSEEVRLSMPLGRHLDWLLGAFYTHEYTDYLQKILAANEFTGAVVGDGFHLHWWDAYTEYALYTDLTVHFTDRFDVQLGGREGQSRESFLEIDSGLYTPDFDGVPSPYDYGGKVHSKNNSFTYLAAPRLKLTDNSMIYARVASGFRAGGANGGVPFQFNVSPTFNPDKTANYEVGFKSDLLDRRLSVDASVYYINWNSIQIQVSTPPGFTYIRNASKAKSEGAELSLQARPVEGLNLAAWLAWNEAVLVNGFPKGSNAKAAAGDRLPYSPRISGNLSADDEFALFGDWRGFVGAAVSYVGGREGGFTGGTPRRYLPVYSKTDLRAGVKYSGWTFSVFANNVTDKRGRLYTDTTGFAAIIQPRTIGLSAWKSF